MARYVAKAKAAEIERMPVERRIAHLVAYTATLEGNAIDDVLTILDDAVGGLLSRVERYGRRRRLRTLGDLDGAAMALREAWFELKAAAEDPEADLRATVVRLGVECVDWAGQRWRSWPGHLTTATSGISRAAPRTSAASCRWPR